MFFNNHRPTDRINIHWRVPVIVMVVAATADFSSRIDHLRDRLRSAARGRTQALSRRVHAADGRPAFAGFRGRLAMRGRYAGDLAHSLDRLLRATLGARERRRQQGERQLAAFDPRGRLGQIRARLVGASEQLAAAADVRKHRARAHFANVTARLDALSPMAVLARGYSVCWTGDGARVVRAARDVAVGDAIRVTLSDGTIAAKVSGTE